MSQVWNTKYKICYILKCGMDKCLCL